ncbi:hypothetical protein AB0I53_45425 [Saccharopolyspora sp. NPDC050389]
MGQSSLHIGHQCGATVLDTVVADGHELHKILVELDQDLAQ